VGARARITVIRCLARLTGTPGDVCSLFAVGGPARRVRTSGLRYPLDGEDLLPGSTRGLSNELVDPVVTVSIEHGTLLALQPDFGGTCPCADPTRSSSPSRCSWWRRSSPRRSRRRRRRRAAPATRRSP